MISPTPKKQRNIVNPRKSRRKSPTARGRIIKLTPLERPVTPKHVETLTFAAIEIQKIIRGWNVRKHSLLLHVMDDDSSFNSSLSIPQTARSSSILSTARTAVTKTSAAIRGKRSLLDRAMDADKTIHIPDPKAMNHDAELKHLHFFVEKIRKGLPGRFAWEKHIHRNAPDFKDEKKHPLADIPIVIKGPPPYYLPTIKASERVMVDTFQLVREKRIDFLCYLFDHVGVSISQRDGRFTRHGRSCLHVSCAIGDDHITYILLARGADPNIRDQHGRSPLFLATRNGNINCVRLLIAFGANVDLVDVKKNKLRFETLKNQTAQEHAQDEADAGNENVILCIQWIGVGRELNDYIKAKRTLIMVHGH